MPKTPRNRTTSSAKTNQPYAIAALVVACSAAGCARDTYQYGISKADLKSRLPNTPNLIVVGGPHPNLDAMERKIQYPVKLLRSWFPSKDPTAKLSDEERRLNAVKTASDYLDANGLQGINIDVREYNPSEQWSRLRNNRRIAPFWKYTGGTMCHLGYCLLPGRVFGYDKYNAYTNTLSINSTSPSRAIAQAGYVKKIYDQRYPGTYIAANLLPVFPLFRDMSVTSDVLTYAKVNEDLPLEKQLLPEAYGRLGGDMVSQATFFIPSSTYVPFYVTPLLSGAGSAVGSVTGKAIADQRQTESTNRILR